MREDNTILGKTYVYEYDKAGNITKKHTYALTAEWDEPSELVDSYSYGYGSADWGDLLTSYNGDTIRYDAIGNPLRYSNGNRWSFTWEHGRRLSQAEGNGCPLFFTYNDEGIRTSKTGNSTLLYLTPHKLMESPAPRCGAGLFKRAIFIA